MSDFRHILASLLKRAAIALPIFALGLFILFRAGGSVMQGFAWGLFGTAAILVGSIIMAFPLARLIAEQSGNLFWSNRRFDRPQPMYSIPQSKKAKGLYEEAMAGFEKIAAEYTDEVKPYVEMIDIAIVKLQDADRANAIYQRGLLALKKDKDKEELARMYSAIRTRLKARPGH